MDGELSFLGQKPTVLTLPRWGQSMPRFQYKEFVLLGKSKNCLTEQSTLKARIGLQSMKAAASKELSGVDTDFLPKDVVPQIPHSKLLRLFSWRLNKPQSILQKIPAN